MFKLVVLSALVAVAMAKPQVHQTAVSYSSPLMGHSSTFVASGSPAGSAISSSLSSASLPGNFVANSAQAYSAPGFYLYTPNYASYPSAFASSQGSQFSTPAAHDARDFQNEFNNNFEQQNGHEFERGNDYNNRNGFTNQPNYY